MYIYICKSCGKEFKSNYKERSFCSRECYKGFLFPNKKRNYFKNKGLIIMKFLSENLNCSKEDLYKQFPFNSKNHLGRYLNILQKIKEGIKNERN